MSARAPRPQVWNAPIAIGLATAVGLVAALLSDGVGDVASWIALAVPIAAAGYYWIRRT